MTKYLILDFGKVLAYPTTGHWFITPLFLKIININKLDLDNLNLAMKKYNYILSEKVVTLEEEYKMFHKFYQKVFKEINYSINNNELDKITYDIVYNEDKYKFYDNVKKELEILSKKYKLLLLSDNWPCAINFLKKAKIFNYFDKLYISSFYGVEKKDKIFFDYPINDYKIGEKEAIFIDDNETLLDIAVEKGLNVRLMNRECIKLTSKYKIINNLLEL